MVNIIFDAGYLLTHALDKLEREGSLNPIYGAIKKDGEKIVKVIKEDSLEVSIPQVISMLEENSQNAESAVAIYPAELENEFGERYSAIIVYAQKYETNEYIIIAQEYQLENGKVIPKENELLDFHDFMSTKLDILEEQFTKGVTSHHKAFSIWKERFK